MNQENTPLTIATLAAKILRNKKGVDVKLFDVRENAPFTDYYVIATGRSHTHMQALANALLDDLAEAGYHVSAVNGRNSDTWILLDLSFAIVHIFSRESREFYNIERLIPREKEIPLPEEDEV